MNPNDLFCSFCGKDKADVRKLIAGGGSQPSKDRVLAQVFICDGCIALCNEIPEVAPPTKEPAAVDDTASPRTGAKRMRRLAFPTALFADETRRASERSLKSVLDGLANNANHAYWCRRLLEEHIPHAEAERLRPQLVQALATWVSVDPGWFARDEAFGPFWYAALLGQWSEEMFEEVEHLVTIADPSLRHGALARIWWTAYGAAGRTAGNAEKAARHLLKVGKRDRGPQYAANLAMILAAVEPASLRRLAKALIACPAAREVAHTWVALLENDSRLERWAAYAHRRKVYRAFQRAGVTTKRDDRHVAELDAMGKTRGTRSDGSPLPSR